MSKAKNSPLRDKMLELHRAGVDVRFVGDDETQIFVINMKEGVEFSEYARILEEVRCSINRSVESATPAKLTRQSALSFVEGMKKLNQ